jgi:hypothetical protein
MSSKSLRAGRWLAPLAILWPFAADAHIQWFANVDLSTAPRTPWDVMTNPSFAALSLLALVVLALAGAADAWLTRAAPRQALLARVQSFDVREGGLAIMRFGLAAFLVANVLYFRDAPVILTPELKAASYWPDVVQLGIAAACLFGRMRLAAAGLVLLFGYAAMDYGLFHLSEYPVFPGIAAYLVMAGRGPAWRARATMVLRVAVALSLMWGGVEKWLFPQWTFPLLCGSGKALTMGLPPEFFMQAAGFIEFCLSFVVVIGSVAGRVAALAVNVVFAAAMPMFGMVDVVGHAPFMLALVIVALSPNAIAPLVGHAAVRRQGLRWGSTFLTTLVGLPALYFVTHELAFGRMRLASTATDIAIALPLIGIAATWLIVRLVGARRMGDVA